MVSDQISKLFDNQFSPNICVKQGENMIFFNDNCHSFLAKTTATLTKL